ncbi:hypothetical protein D9M68_953440 [compost metagenome]
MNTATFHTHTGTYRIDTVIIAFYCYFCTLTWLSYNFLDRDQAILDFRNFNFQKFFQERGMCSAQDDYRSIAAHFYFLYYCTQWLSFTEKVAGNLLRFRQ